MKIREILMSYMGTALYMTAVFGLMFGTLAKAKMVESIYFETDSAVVMPGEVAKIERVTDAVHAGRYDIVILIGNADVRASNSYNFDLAKRRAEAVKDYMQMLGIDDEIKITVSHGEEEPVSPRLKDNRRVDVHLFAKKVVKELDMNMLMVHGGVGAHGIREKDRQPFSVTVEQAMNPVFGITYMRRIHKCLHVGATLMTNPTYTFNLGCAF